MKEKVNQQLALLEEQMNTQRLDKATQRIRALLSERSERFTENGDGTITDKKTGLKWTIIDGLTTTNDCMAYDSAVDYVKALQTRRPRRLAPANAKRTGDPCTRRRRSFPETEGQRGTGRPKTNRRYMGSWVNGCGSGDIDQQHRLGT